MIPMIKKRMSAPYREVSSRLKRLLTEGRVIEGSLYRSDRGNTPRHQLSDRATGRFRNIYVPADFAEDVAAWSAKLGGGEAPAEGDERDRPRRARGGDHGEDGAQDRREAGKGRARKRVGRPAECVRSVPVGIPSGGLSCPEQAVPQGLVAQNRLQMSTAARRSRDARGHL